MITGRSAMSIAFEEVAAEPLTLYPGNLQGRNIRETGAKGAVLITVEDGSPRYRRITLDRARFEAVSVTIEPAMRESDILQAVETALSDFAEVADERPVALRLTLEGQNSDANRMIAAHGEWHDDLQAACQRVHADLWLEKLVIALVLPETAPHPSEDNDLDITAMIDAIAADDAMAGEIEALINEIAVKLPGGIAAKEEAFSSDHADLLAEARAIVAARLEG